MDSPRKDDHIEFDAASGRALSPPRQFFLELTGRCNLCCVHCPVDYGTPEGKARGELPLATVQKLLPWLRSADSINLNIVGEPLIYSRFLDVLELLGPACERTHFNTNGIAITPALARELVRRHLGSIVISVDGMESNAAVRGVPYDFVRAKVALLCAEKRAQGAEAPLVSVAYTLMARNLFELRPVLEDIAGLGIHAMHVQPLVVFYESLRAENIYACHEVDAVLRECKARAEDLGIEMVVAVEHGRAQPAPRGGARPTRALLGEVRLLGSVLRDEDPPHRRGAGLLARLVDRTQRERPRARRDLEPRLVPQPAQAPVRQALRGRLRTLPVPVRVAGEPGGPAPTWRAPLARGAPARGAPRAL